MAVHADPGDQEIVSPRTPSSLFVTLVRQINVGGTHIDVIQKDTPQIYPKRLWVTGAQPHIFVKKKKLNLREVELILPAHRHRFLVHPPCRLRRRDTQHDYRLRATHIGERPRSLPLLLV